MDTRSDLVTVGTAPRRPRPPWYRQVHPLVLLAAGLGLAGLVALTLLGRHTDRTLATTSDSLTALSSTVAAACDTGQVAPRPEGVAACARATAVRDGVPLDGPRLAATLRAVIEANTAAGNAAAARDPRAVAAAVAPLLPGIGPDALARASAAQVAAAQGSASASDADDVTAAAARADGAAPDPAPTRRAVEVTFTRGADGSCTATTAYSDGTSANMPADDASCPPRQVREEPEPSRAPEQPGSPASTEPGPASSSETVPAPTTEAPTSTEAPLLPPLLN